MDGLALSAVDPDRNNESYHPMWLEASGQAYLSHSLIFDVPHMTGRAIDALLRGESVSGHPIPAGVEAILTSKVFESFNNPHKLNSYISDVDGLPHVEFHNLREGLTGLNALIEYRQKVQAVFVGHDMLLSLNSITLPSGAFSATAIANQGKTSFYHGAPNSNPAVYQGRMIGPLVKYFQLTSNPLALELATKYASVSLNQTFTTTGHLVGAYNTAGAGNHVHSITSTLSSLLYWAEEMANQQQAVPDVVERLRLAFDNSLTSEGLQSSWGWIKEVRDPDPSLTRGEANQTGDMIQAALVLGRLGYPEYYEVAERYLRNFVLPSQYLSTATLSENPGLTADQYQNIRQRAHGSWGFALPTDRLGDTSTVNIHAVDVTSGVVQAISEAMSSIYAHEGDSLAVNLYFDVSDSVIDIVSGLPSDGNLAITPAIDTDVLIRKPSWLNVNDISITVDGQLSTFSLQGDYLSVPDVHSGELIEMEFPLLQRTTTETILGVQYEAEWLGDTIVAMSPDGTRQPLYQFTPPPTQVWGVVSDAQGTPLENETVKLLNDQGEVIATFVTDADGNYAIDVDLESGKYRIETSSQAVANVTIEKYRPATVNFPFSTMPGNFDFDNDVDGSDFLAWQRGQSPHPLNATDLAKWEASYGAYSELLDTQTSAVPEPDACLLTLLAASVAAGRRRKTRSRASRGSQSQDGCASDDYLPFEVQCAEL
jgi:hypothetical protein